MKNIFDQTAEKCAVLVTRQYSTSFSIAVKLLAPSIRKDIYNIYGFVRFVDEIVDSFHDYDKEKLLNKFEVDYYESLEDGISLNPILNAFQHTVRTYGISHDMVASFFKSMRADLTVKNYDSVEQYHEYIYGSADVVGLMCLKVFVHGEDEKYEALRPAAMRLGSAFQKVNFLRDLKDDVEILDRSYFPNIDFQNFANHNKEEIIADIEADFDYAYRYGILKLPVEAKFGVYVAYRYYKRLLHKINATPIAEILDGRIRISNLTKLSLMAQSYLRYRLNLL
ncbi:phytoene/squalene synthase family protein [Membranihabitans marinus]|uniref:phytoene/squalene synthase family protein n=1 Tax=Membranihabitans marinus TaxID=1227546 RepID=UPI001F430D81|nr:phytoene/squalene synthase family protein [Membranihabitans marinus]